MLYCLEKNCPFLFLLKGHARAAQVNHMNRFRFTRSLLLCFLLTAALFLGGCGDLVQLSGLLLDTSTSVSLPSAAADARAPGLSAVMATASGQEGENRPASAGQSSGSGTASANLSPYYENFSIFLPKLNEAEYTNFIALYQGIRTFREKITLPLPASSDEVQKLMTLLSNDCPELMQLGSQWGQNSNLLGSVISVSPTYICGREEWERQNAEIQRTSRPFFPQQKFADPYLANSRDTGDHQINRDEQHKSHRQDAAAEKQSVKACFQRILFAFHGMLL